MTRERLTSLAPYLVEASQILRHTRGRNGEVHRRVGAACCHECRWLALWLASDPSQVGFQVGAYSRDSRSGAGLHGKTLEQGETPGPTTSLPDKHTGDAPKAP